MQIISSQTLRIEAIQEHSVPVFAFNPVLFRRVEGMGFSTRPANRLRTDGVTYVGELIQKTESDLLHNSNFGLKSLKEIKYRLAEMGLHLGMEVTGWPPDNIEALAQQYEQHLT